MMAAVAALCVAFTANAHAGSVEYAAANIQIDVPAGWSAQEADGNLTVASPDGSVAIVVGMMPDAKSAKKGAASLDKSLAPVFPDLKLGKAKKAAVNELKGYLRRGDASVNGQPVEMGIMVLAAPNGTIFMVLALGVVGLYEPYGDQMNAALQSISKVRTKMPEAFYRELGDAEARKVVEAVLLAIDQNDSAALSKHIAKDFSYFGKAMKASTVKRKANNKVAKWMKVPDGGWLWDVAAGPAFTIHKGSGYGKTWSIEFFDESAEDMDATTSRWRIYAITYHDLGAP